MTDADVSKVNVPDADRPQLTELLKSAYARNPIPAYEPTEDNLRRLYLRSKSAASQFITPKK